MSGAGYSRTQRQIPEEGVAYSALRLETNTVKVIHESVKRYIPLSKTLPFGAFTTLAPGQSLHTLKLHSLDLLDTRSERMQASFCPSPQSPGSQQTVKCGEIYLF